MATTSDKRLAELKGMLGDVLGELRDMPASKLGTAWHSDRCDAARALSERIEILAASTAAAASDTALYELKSDGTFAVDFDLETAKEASRLYDMASDDCYIPPISGGSPDEDRPTPTGWDAVETDVPTEPTRLEQINAKIEELDGEIAILEANRPARPSKQHHAKLAGLRQYRVMLTHQRRIEQSIG